MSGKTNTPLVNKLFTFTVGLLVVTLIVVTTLVLTGNTPDTPVDKEYILQEQIWDLNARYVFVYPHPQDLPAGVNLCVDVIKEGDLRDTVWLMPDHESAGF
jgi:hypothetical protein